MILVWSFIIDVSMHLCNVRHNNRERDRVVDNWGLSWAETKWTQAEWV